MLQRLLETNLLMAGSGHNATFGYNTEIKQVVLYCMLPLDQSSGMLTLAMLRHFAAVAEQWRTTWFLDEKDSSNDKGGKAAQGARSRLDAQLRHPGSGAEGSPA